MGKTTLERVLRDMRSHPDARANIFLSLPSEQRAMILLHLTRYTLHQLLEKLKDEEIVTSLEHLDPDEVTDVLQILHRKRQQVIIHALSERLKKDVKILTEFDPNTAAGLMNLDYILADENETVASVAKQLKIHESRTGRLPAILATRGGHLIGYLPGHALGFEKASESIKKHIRTIHSIHHNANKDAILSVFRNYPHDKIVVLGESGNVLGIIYSDDILRLLQEQETASLYDFAGVHDEESVDDGVRAKVHFRYRWLILNLATAFLAAFTVSLFGETISKYVLLAVYMPIVAGMGGNAATQTLAILVRGIALKQIDLSTAWATVRRELGAGFFNGLINGAIVLAIVFTFNHDLKIGIILGIAMVINLLVASFFGTLVPLVMHRLGKDPATSATIFITTATDVLGFLAFLGLATLFLD